MPACQKTAARMLYLKTRGSVSGVEHKAVPRQFHRVLFLLSTRCIRFALSLRVGLIVTETTEKPPKIKET